MRVTPLCSKCDAQPKRPKHSWCQGCLNEHTRSWQAKNREKVKATKRRSRQKHQDRANAYNREWRAQNPEYHAQWQKENRHRLYGYRLRTVYNISGERYADLLANQGGVCGICNTPPNGKPLGVDHCHGTQEIRGLLCNRCNMAIGAFRDNRRLMTSAMKYLAQPRLALTQPSHKGERKSP